VTSDSLDVHSFVSAHFTVTVKIKAMNASEQLIKAAKNGNVKEVRKLLSKGALFTKDEVSTVVSLASHHFPL
jgi:hypothetical protein